MFHLCQHFTIHAGVIYCSFSTKKIPTFLPTVLTTSFKWHLPADLLCSNLRKARQWTTWTPSKAKDYSIQLLWRSGKLLSQTTIFLVGWRRSWSSLRHEVVVKSVTGLPSISRFEAEWVWVWCLTLCGNGGRGLNQKQTMKDLVRDRLSHSSLTFLEDLANLREQFRYSYRRGQPVQFNCALRSCCISDTHATELPWRSGIWRFLSDELDCRECGYISVPCTG